MERLERRKRVVIVGGGIAGALVAKSVQEVADVVLIDPKEYMEIPWAYLRSGADPAFAERSIIGHYEYLENGKLITSAAVNVTETEVATAEGAFVAYDYLVIATGHSHTLARTRRDRLEEFQEENHKLKCSGSIMVVGGGPAGVELAGDIIMDYPEKKVTLVHSGPRLLQFIGTKASAKALEWLKSKSVDVLLEQSIDVASISEEEREFRTSAGEIVEADSYFLCMGKQVGSSWLRKSILKEYVDRKGRVMVDENLRVGGLNNIFAVGDITDIPEIKQGILAQRHALICAKNLKLLLKGGKDCKLGRYKPSHPRTWVSLGRKEAVAQFSLLTVSGFLPGIFRSRELFVSKTRKLMGLD